MKEFNYEFSTGNIIQISYFVGLKCTKQGVTVVENVDIYERLTRFENPEDIKYLVGIAGC